MAGEATEVVDEKAQALAEDTDFNAGFEAVAPTETPDEDTPEATPEPTPAPVEAPKLAQITEEQFQDLLKKATEIDAIKADQTKRFDSAFGHIGQFKQQLEKLQATGTGGKPIELTPEDFAELRAEYPDLVEPTVKGLSKVLSRIQGQAPDTSKLEQQFATQSAQTRTEVIDAHLDAIVDGDWRAERNSPAFTAWEATWTDKEKELANGVSLRDAASLMRMYQKVKSIPAVAVNPVATPAPTPAPVSSRTRVLQAAVNPKGSAAVSRTPSDDDEFDAAFKGG